LRALPWVKWPRSCARFPWTHRGTDIAKLKGENTALRGKQAGQTKEVAAKVSETTSLRARVDHQAKEFGDEGRDDCVEDAGRGAGGKDRDAEVGVSGLKPEVAVPLGIGI
jgi:hypothetical protein